MRVFSLSHSLCTGLANIRAQAMARKKRKQQQQQHQQQQEEGGMMNGTTSKEENEDRRSSGGSSESSSSNDEESEEEEEEGGSSSDGDTSGGNSCRDNETGDVSEELEKRRTPGSEVSKLYFTTRNPNPVGCSGPDFHIPYLARGSVRH